jgi:16S rRNA (guanine527-N7)-methyltransferase
VEPLEAWLAAVVAAPGMTSLDLGAARRVLAEEALLALPVVDRYQGVVVDVGSGNGSPGIPLALALPARECVLLEAEERRCAFLRLWAPPNARVVRGRAEEQETDWAGLALAKALAPPPVAAEWCLPLVRPGGAAVLWVGPSADFARVLAVAAKLNAELTSSPPGLAVLEKTGPTPEGFPRRAGIARKRPLA